MIGLLNFEVKSKHSHSFLYINTHVPAERAETLLKFFQRKKSFCWSFQKSHWLKNTKKFMEAAFEKRKSFSVLNVLFITFIKFALRKVSISIHQKLSLMCVMSYVFNLFLYFYCFSFRIRGFHLV